MATKCVSCIVFCNIFASTCFMQLCSRSAALQLQLQSQLVPQQCATFPGHSIRSQAKESARENCAQMRGTLLPGAIPSDAQATGNVASRRAAFGVAASMGERQESTAHHRDAGRAQQAAGSVSRVDHQRTIPNDARML